MPILPLSESPLPCEPPRVAASLRPIGGRVGPAPTDFQVEEIPAYLPSGTGDHRYLRIEKTAMTTPELVRLCARSAGVNERDVGTAGLKDKHAVTTQWVSLPLRSRPVSEWSLPETVRVLEESRHSNKLRTGHLIANRFTIRLVDVSPEAPALLPLLVERIQAGLFNGFGEQRFGRDGSNVSTALRWLRGGQPLYGRKARLLTKLYPSVVQSELFNRYLLRRQERGLGHLLRGEIVRLEGSGASFVVEDLATEQSRYERGELHPQGPLFGPKMRPAADETAELERQVLREAGIEESDLAALGRHAPGTRRDIMVSPENLSAKVESDGAVTLAFVLPSGGYATLVVREFTGARWLAGEGPRPEEGSIPCPPDEPEPLEE